MEQRVLEYNIIAGIFRDEKYLDDFIARTKTEYFSDPLAKKARDWVGKNYRKGDKISIIRASEEIEIDDIIFGAEIPFEFTAWLDTLYKNYMQRSLKEAAGEIFKLAENKKLSVEEYLAKSQDIIFALGSSDSQSDGNVSFEEAMLKAHSDFILEIEENKLSGLKTGFVNLDKNTGGLHNAHLTVIAGQTSMGKTAFALSLVDNLIKKKKKVKIFSLEMVAKELVDRLLLMNAGVPGRDFNNRRLTDKQLNALDQARSKLSDYYDYLSINEKRGLTIEDIKAYARKDFKNNKYDLLIIDYLQMIKLPGKRSTAKEVGEAVKEIRNFAGELNVPLVLLSQLNREVTGRPKLKHLRDSGEIEEAADEVWFVFRPDYNREVMHQEQIKQKAELIQAKGRTTGVGISQFNFYPEIGLWRDAFMEDNGYQLQVPIIRRK